MQYKNILLIDDDEEDNEIFMTALDSVSSDFLCAAYTNASKALVSLQSREIEPDVIFLDLNMPIMSGQEFLIQIKKEKIIQNIPVIIFSTSSNPETIALAKKLGAEDFVTKPDRLEKLVDILKTIVL
jgi:CheY-like chemotaxis protein